MRTLVGGLLALALVLTVMLATHGVQLRWLAKRHCVRAGFQPATKAYATCLAEEIAGREQEEPEWGGIPIIYRGG